MFEGVDAEDSYMFANKMRRLVNEKKFFMPGLKTLRFQTWQDQRFYQATMENLTNQEVEPERRKKQGATPKRLSPVGKGHHKVNTDDNGYEYLRVSVSVV